MLITIEGIDGSGKSTLMETLRQRCRDLDPVFTREPGATWVGEQVRRAVAEGADPITEALLFIADHAAHLSSVVVPALEEGRTVISDRFTDSRYAYQSVTLAGLVPDPMEWLTRCHAGWSPRPDLTFLLVLPPEEAVARLDSTSTREHFESADVLARVQESYMRLVRDDPGRFLVVDALLTPESVSGFVETEIRRAVVEKKR